MIPFFKISRLILEPRDDSTVEHCSPTVKICHIAGGRGQWRIGGKEYPIETGDVFILNNVEIRILHKIIPPQPLKMIILDFEPRFIWINGFNLFDSNILGIFFSRKKNFNNRIDNLNPMSRLVKEAIQDIDREYSEKLPKYEEVIKIKIVSLLTLLNRHYINEVEPASVSSHGNAENLALINHVLEYIDQHIAEDLNLDKLSSLVHMNPSYFSTIFKKNNGISLSQYILRKRISLAIELLRNEELTVLSIAHRCGFNSPANFYKYFKSLTGRTPTYFRKNKASLNI
ncbi:MAG: AraC family transcriptional regulator [Caldicoprobacterales bacterium]|nr:AraC family transcriptional regulator [Clostridiales bacterium]